MLMIVLWLVAQASEREENYEEQIRNLTARLNEVRICHHNYVQILSTLCSEKY